MNIYTLTPTAIHMHSYTSIGTRGGRSKRGEGDIHIYIYILHRTYVYMYLHIYIHMYVRIYTHTPTHIHTH